MNTVQQVPDEVRREIFLAIVDAQDRNVPVKESRDTVAQKFSLTESQIRAIEREGLDSCWPPLC